MRFSPDFIDKVRDATNIVEIISQHTQLKRSGHGFTGLCPFPDHKEKTASFSVSDTKQAFYCFGCKRGGNVFTFLRHYQGLPFPEAVELLANRANIPMPVTANDGVAQREEELRKNLLKINRDTALFYHNKLRSLSPQHPVRAYIAKRGLSEETVDQFMLGYGPDSWSELADHLKSERQLGFAEKLGLVRARKGQGSGFYDIFRNRLMFPIVSPLGEVLGFGGRILGDGQPKYLNSSDSPVFTKGRVFYGLNEASNHIRAEDAVVVVEGYMDFLALFQAGIRNVVATLGTALTDDHAKLIKRYTKNVVVLFDGDAAGQAAADRSLPILLKNELLPRGLALPDGLDPDEYVRKVGFENMKAQINSAPDLFVAYLGRVLGKLGSRSTDKVRLMELVKPVLLQTADERLRDLYMQELASRLSVSVAWVQKSLRGARVEPPAPVPPRPTAAKNNSNIKDLAPVIPNEEKMILGLALHDQALFEHVRDSGVEEYLASSEVRDILARVVQLYGQRPSDFDRLAAILSSEFDDPSLLTQHLDPKLNGLNEEQGKKILRDCVQKVKQRFLKSQASAIINDLRTQTDPEKLEQFVNILRDRKTLENE